MTNPADSAAILRQLREQADREQADEAFLQPTLMKEPGQHQADLPELGLRVSLTRSRYPFGKGQAEMYALTISRLAMDKKPPAMETQLVLRTLFGEQVEIQERLSGSLVRLFRVPALNDRQSRSCLEVAQSDIRPKAQC